VAVGEKPSAIVRRQARDSARAGSSPPWAHGSPCGAGVSVTLPSDGGRRVDPARRACL